MHEAKTHLSRLVAELKPGEALQLCIRNEPVAELSPIRKTNKPKPRIGVAKGEFEVPDSFLDPLPDHILKAFSGQ